LEEEARTIGRNAAYSPANYRPACGRADIIGIFDMRTEPIDRQCFRRMCEARELLLSGLDREMTVAEAALVAGLSPYHFIRKFEALFGQTPRQLRIQARLDRA
jgi:AraC-like DNA-binding protein